jgi:ADP-ribose pyrophosphatase
MHASIVRSAGLGGVHRYLTVHELEVRNEHQNGELGPRYTYECLSRKHLDAVVLLLHSRVLGRRCVCLRASLRPPLLLRAFAQLAMPDEGERFWLWELPAGLIEPSSDKGEMGIRFRASIEAEEETGYAVAAERFEILPGAPFLSPGVLPERIHFAAAEILDTDARSEAAGDGSPVEHGSVIEWIPLDEALGHAARGSLVDAKTELGLWRLVSKLGQAGV